MGFVRCAKRVRVVRAAVAGVVAGLGCSAAGAVHTFRGAGGTTAAPVSGNFSDPNAWDVAAVSDTTTELRFNGSGAVPYTATDDVFGDFNLNLLRLGSSATVANTITASDPLYRLNFFNNGATAPQVIQGGSGAFNIHIPLFLSGTSTVTFGGTGSGQVTLFGDISGATAVTFSNGRYVLSGTSASSYSGVTTVSGGTHTVNAGAVAIPGALTVSNGTLNLNGTTAVIGGAVTLTNGTITYGAGDQIGDGNNLTVNNGTFALGAFSDSIGDLTVGGGTLSGTTGVLTVNQVTTTGGTISASLAGFGGLTKNGAGMTVLSGANTFTGGVDHRAGTLVVQGADGTIAGASGVSLGFDIAPTLTLDNAAANNNNRVGDTAPVTVTASGGNVHLVGNAGGTAEQVGGLTFNGVTTVTVTSTGGGAAQLTSDSLSRSGGAIDFRGVGGTLGAAGGNPRVVFTAPPVAVAGDLIGAWATVNGADFASHDPVNGIVAFTNYTPLPASGFSPSTVYSAGGNVTLTGSGNVLALKLGTATAQTINLGANTLTVDSGGVVSGGAGVTTIDGTGSLVLVNEGLFTVGNGTVVVNAPLEAPTLVKNGGGHLTVVLSGTTAATWMSGGGAFNGELELKASTPQTAQTLTGVFRGGGTLVKTGPGRVTLSNAENTFANVRVDEGVLEALGVGVSIDFNNANNTNHLGSNTIAPAIINGGTLKLTTVTNGASAGALNLNRPVTWTDLGGTLDLTNAFGGTTGGGNTTVDGISIGGGGGGVGVTTSGSSNAAAAVIKWNGGQYGLSSLTAPRDWSTGGNTLRFTAIAGTGVVRVELSNGAGVRHGTNPGGTSTNTVNTPFVISGPSVASGGDPTSGPDGTLNSGIATNVGRIMNDGFAVINYTRGLSLEGALQTGAQGAARAMDGNITLRGIASGNPAYVSFHGRGTGTALGPNLQNPGQGGTGINPLYVGFGRNDTLTIEDGATAVMDLRVRTDQNNHNGVMLDARTVIRAGGKLDFRQSISNFTSSDTGIVNPGNAGFHTVRNDIEGQGTTAKEAVVDLYLPFDDSVATASPLGGVNFQGTNVAVVVNGSGVGGLRVNGLARPTVVVSGPGGAPDPVSNADKVANLLSAARLAAVTGSGGYLTPAPQGVTFAFPAGGEWAPGVAVGLRAVNSNAGGADVSLPAGTWGHSLHVDAGAEMVATGVTVNSGTVSGGGTITTGAGAGRLTAGAGGRVAPSVGTSAATLTVAGDLTFTASSGFDVRVNGAAAGTGFSQLVAGAGAVALSGNLAIARDPAFNPTPYGHLVVLSGSAATGHFDTVSGMEAGNNLLFAAIYTALGVELVPAVPGDVTLDKSVDFNDLVKLAQNYNTAAAMTWVTGDFTGDGATDFNDLVKLAQNYNTSLPAGGIAGAPAGFEGDLARAFASVPEPGTAGLVAAAGAVMMSRRRRRRG